MALDLIPLIIDNGGYSIKYGVASSSPSSSSAPDRPGWGSPLMITNGIVKTKSGRKYVGGEIDQLSDISGLLLRRGFEKGYVVNWELESQVWSSLLDETGLEVTPSETALLTTERLLCPASLQQLSSEVLFETFGFASVTKRDPSVLAWHHYLSTLENSSSSSSSNTPSSPSSSPSSSSLSTSSSTSIIPSCGLVVDCGYSSSTAVPLMQGFPLNYATRRMDMGGRALTNYLKELVSFRQYNMDEETILLDRIKEKYCFVSSSFLQDLQRSQKFGSQNPIRTVFPISQIAGWVEPNDESDHEQPSSNSLFDTLRDDGDDGDGDDDNENKTSQFNAMHNSSQPEKPGEESKEESHHPLLDQAPPTELLSSHRDASRSHRTAKRSRGDSEAQLFVMNSERICVPELLFNPSDVGVLQSGIDEMVVQSVSATNDLLHPSLYGNIFVYGGSTQFPGFQDRFHSALRCLVPDQFPINVVFSSEPHFSPWYGAASLIRNDPSFLLTECVTRQDYSERGFGSTFAMRKFSLY